jgi:hypothetical protein
MAYASVAKQVIVLDRALKVEAVEQRLLHQPPLASRPLWRFKGTPTHTCFGRTPPFQGGPCMLRATCHRVHTPEPPAILKSP